MTEKYFVTLETAESQLVRQLMPGSEKYGFDSLIAITENLASDIEGIHIATALADKISGFEIDRKFNAKFFPHLKSEFVFSHDEYEQKTQLELIESNYVVKRINVFDEDKDQKGQIAVCVKPVQSQSSFEDLLSDESAHHFSKHTVTKNHVLN